MQIDFDTVIVTQLGKPMEFEEEGVKIPCTLRLMAVSALCGVYEDDRNKPGEEKAKRGWLAQKISNGFKGELKAEEVSQVKEYIGKRWGPWEIAQCWKLLDPAEDESEQG